MLESTEVNSVHSDTYFDEDEVKFGARKTVVPYTPNDIFSVSADEVSLNKNLSKAYDDLQKQFTGIEGAGSKAAHEKDNITAYDLFDVAHPMYNLEYLQEMYLGDYTNFSAINAKVANIVGLGYDFVESPKTLEKEDKIDDDSDKMHAFRAKLARTKREMFNRIDSMNMEDEFVETLEKIVVDYESTGNGYLEIGRTNSGAIGYIGHIPAHTIRVRRKRDGFVQFVNGNPVFFRRYGDAKTKDPFNNDAKPNEIIHFKKYNPKDNYYGCPDIIPALTAVAGNKFADEYNLDFFENKAVPRNLIIMRGGKLTDAAQRKLLRFFGEDLRGSHHRALYVPLPADSQGQKHDIEIRSVESGVQDSAFDRYSRGNIEKILMVHRVPPTKLGMTTESALAAAKDLDKTFKEQVCRPLQRVIEKKINRVISEITDVFLFKLNELDLIDEISQTNIDVAEHAIGAITANEIRIRKGRSGLKGGDRTIFDINDDATTKAQAAAKRSEDKTEGTSGTRNRNTRRAVGRTDSIGGARNPKGEGRTYG